MKCMWFNNDEHKCDLIQSVMKQLFRETSLQNEMVWSCDESLLVLKHDSQLLMFALGLTCHFKRLH